MYLTRWIRQLVVVGLLAGVAEMVLPRGNTRGYVRMVIGLLVMLTILEPVFQLTGDPMVWAQLEDWSRQVELPGLEPLNLEPLQERTRQLTIETYRRRLAGEIYSLVGRVPGLEAVEVTVTLETRPEHPDYGAILAVALVVRPRPAPPGEIRPVRPITLGPGTPEAPEETTPVWPPELETARRRLLELLRLHFGLLPEQVELELVT